VQSTRMELWRKHAGTGLRREAARERRFERFHQFSFSFSIEKKAENENSIFQRYMERSFLQNLYFIPTERTETQIPQKIIF
jgi:hypothetical protein